MLLTLLAKDFRRACRNPVPYLVQLSVPLVITGLLGLVFGGNDGGSDARLGKIKIAVVDEDDTPITKFLRGALSSGQASEHLEAKFLPRAEALQSVTNNLVSAVIIIPTNFTRTYLTKTNQVELELVKNPAQAFHPAIIEELLKAAAAGLNAVKRNFYSSLGDWREVLSGDHMPSMREVSALTSSTADKLEAVRHRLDPLPVWFAKEETSGKAVSAKGENILTNIFAFLLPGLAAMFLLFLADVAMRDLGREILQRTFQRFCSLPAGPAVFVASKVVFTVAMVLTGAAILLGAGGLVFGVHWHRPAAVAALCGAYALFGGGLLAVFSALSRGRGPEVVNTILLLLLGLASGGAFPANALPEFMRVHITPHLPPAWFIESVRATHFESASSIWMTATLKLALLGLLLTGLSAWLFRRKLNRNELA